MLIISFVSLSLVINNFSSTSTPDWVEVVNESDAQINFSEYLILDTAGNDIKKDILIPAKGNCVFDWSNKLNKAGDEIILKKGDQEIDCVRYGDSEGKCADTRTPTETKPSSSCFESTPTPAPTVVLTPPPTPVRTPEVLSAAEATSPSPSSRTSVSEDAGSIQISTLDSRLRGNDEATDNEEVLVIGGEDNKYLPFASIFGGLSLSLGSAAYVFKKEYNERHPPTST